MLELVLENAPHDRSTRPVAVRAPDFEILPHAVDFDRFQNEMDGRAAEEAAGQDDELELQPSSEIQALDAQTEEVLPEGEMARFDGDQPVEDGCELIGG